MENDDMRGVWKLTALTVLISLVIIAIGVVLTPKAIGAEIVKVDSRVVVVSGSLLAGDAEKLDAILLENDSVDTVYLSSPGGLLVVGVKMGRVMARHPSVAVAVHKKDKCISACALVFLGAHRQYLEGKLAFHRAWSAETYDDPDRHFSEGQQVATYVNGYIVETGYHSHLLWIMASDTSRNKFFVISSLEDLNVLFVGDPKKTPAHKFFRDSGIKKSWVKSRILHGSLF